MMHEYPLMEEPFKPKQATLGPTPSGNNPKLTQGEWSTIVHKAKNGRNSNNSNGNPSTQEGGSVLSNTFNIRGLSDPAQK